MSTQTKVVDLPQSPERILLEYGKPSQEEAEFYKAYRRGIIGHETPLRHLIKSITSANTLDGQLRPTDKPAGIFFALGTSGSGKTLIAELTAQLLFGSKKSLLKLAGGDYQNPQDTKILTGAPPSYIGYDDEPRITQEKLDQYGFWATVKNPYIRKYLQLQKNIDIAFKNQREHDNTIKAFENNMSFRTADVGLYTKALEGKQSVEEHLGLWMEHRDNILKYYPDIRDQEPPVYNQARGYPSVVLVDELEKTHDNFRKLCLEIFDKGELTITGSHAQTVSFRNTLFFLTSNIGQEEMLKKSGGKIFGFDSSVEAKTDEELELEAKKIRDKIMDYSYEQLTTWFSPEFLGRVGEENIFAFGPLSPLEQLACLQSIVIPEFNHTLDDYFAITTKFSPQVEEFLIKDTKSERKRILGTRALLGIFKDKIRKPIYSFISRPKEEGGVIPGDSIVVEISPNKELQFIIERDHAKNEEAQEILEKKLQRKRELDGPNGLSIFQMLSVDNK